MRLVHVRPKPQNHHKKNSQRKLATASLITGGLIIAALLVNMMRPLPSATVSLQLPQAAAAEPVSLDWPSTGQAAIAATNYGMLGTYGSNTPLATASIAKVITALCVLEKHPLKSDEDGPKITLGKKDVALYQEQLQQNGSNIPVYDGEVITLRQALEAIMLPSANNIADSLAIWSFGSLEKYADYANAYVLRHGLVRTHIGSDASGYDASTKSTASDLAQLGLIAREQSVLMKIANKQTTVLPFVGTVTNYNTVLGQAGINGLKTGNNDENKGALLFTVDISVNGKAIAISGAVMGQDSLPQALRKAVLLASSIPNNFQTITYVTKGSVVGHVKTEWGNSAPITAQTDVTVVRWKGSPVLVQKTIHTTKGTQPATIGAVTISAGSMQAASAIKISAAAVGPSYWWRATRI